MFFQLISAAVATCAFVVSGKPTETVDKNGLRGRAETSTRDQPETTHTIFVGAEGFVFSPNNVNASVGEFVEFRFYPGGHRVARAPFKYPCIPYNLVGTGSVGFSHPDISPQVISDNLPHFQVRVNDTEPIFFYCYAPTSCLEHHMIGVINENETQTLDIQMQYVLNATMQLNPGDGFPTEGTSSSSTATPTSTPVATSPPSVTTSPDSPSAQDNDEPHHSQLSAGAIAGIAIGGAAVLAMVGALLFLCGRRGGLNLGYRKSTTTMPSPMPPVAQQNFVPEHKSPAVGYAAHHYAGSTSGDPYRGNSPHTFASSSAPPLSPDRQTYVSYNSIGGHHLHPEDPFMAGSAEGKPGYYSPAASPPPVELQQQRLHISPVELPASTDSANTPLPQYNHEGRQYSWAQGQETEFRPGNKA